MDTFTLGKNENIDFSKLKSGITKKELGIENDAVLSNIFDSIDKGDENADGKGNGRLERKELISFINKIRELAGEDKKLSKKEANEYEIDGNKLGKDKEKLLEFLQKLSALTKGVQSVDSNEVVLYEDGHTVQVLANGNKKTTSSDKKTVTTTDENGDVIEETVISDNKKTTTCFKNKKKTKSTEENIYNGAKETIIYDEDGETPKSKISETSSSRTKFNYDTKTQKYVPVTKDIKIDDEVEHTEYDTENSDENNRKIKQTTVTKNGKLISKTKDGHSVKYDGQGNTYIIVQPDERDAGKIAKKFGCSKEKLVEINGGKYCFEPGETIIIPGQLEPTDEVLSDRMSAEDSKQAYQAELEAKRQAEAEAKAAKEQAARAARKTTQSHTSYQSTTRGTSGTKQSSASKAKESDWKGKKDVDWVYVQIKYAKGSTAEGIARDIYKREGINNPSDKAVKERANAIRQAYGKYFDASGKIKQEARLNYRISKKINGTVVGKGQNGYYVTKDEQGNVHFYNNARKEISGAEFKKHCPGIYADVTGTERPMSANQKKIQYQSAQQIVADLKKAIRGWNDHDAIRNALNKIDNQEELLEVNRLLAKEGYKSDNMYSSLEKFIKEETQRIATDYTCPDLENYIQKWINNGTLKGDYAIRAQARMAARVIIDAGDGFGTDYKKTVKGIRMIKAPKGQGKAGAKKVYDQVNKIIASHRTFYGIGTRSKGLIDYLKGEVWSSEIKYLKGILGENDAIQGKEKAQAVHDLVEEAVSGAGTDIEYLKQAIKAINSPQDRRAVEAKLKQYCQKKGIKPQIQGQSYLQAILYDECDTFLGISRDHKEIRKFNEMLISQGAYTKEEAVNLRAEQAALQILEGNFDNAKDAVQQIKDPKVYAKVLQLVQTKYGGHLDNFLRSKMSQEKADLVQAELAGNGMIAGDSAAKVAFRLIQSSDFNVRAKGLMAIRNGDVAKKVDNMLKAHGSSLAKVMEQFNKEKAEYKSKAAFWDGLAMFGGGYIAEHISDRYRDNTDVSDNMYIEATNATPLTQKQKDAYNQAVKTFEECLNKMKADYQEALDSQGVVSGAINAFCSVYNIGTTRDEIEARIEHDTETLRLLKLAAKGKLTKYINGREVIVSFEQVWKERQSDRVTANAVTITNAVETVRGKKEVTFDAKKVEKVENKAQTLAAMDYAKDNIVLCWDELSNAGTEKQYAVAIMDTLEKLSNMSGKKMSLVYFGYSLKNGIIVDKAGKPVSTAKLQELVNQLKKGLSDVSNSLFGTSLSQDSSGNKVSSVLEKSYDKKVESFKQDYRDAFGQECPDEMIESYMTTISRGMMAANVAVAIGAMVAAPFTGGGSLAVFAMTAGASAAMNGLEHSTDADGWTNSEWTTDLSQAAWDGALAACGYKIGQIAEAFAKGASALSGSNKWISTMLNKMPKAQATKALSKAEEVARKVETYAGKLGKNVLQSKKANLLAKYPAMKPETAEKVATIVARVEAAGFEVSGDTLQSLVQMYCMEGEFNTESFTTALYMSIGANAVGHAVSARSAMKEVKANSTTPQEYPSAHAAKRGGRDAIADGEVARNADQSHLNAKERKIVDDGIDDVPTKEEVDAYQSENGYKKPTAEEKAAIDKNNAESDAANNNAHKVENNIDASSAEALKKAKESAGEVDSNINGVQKKQKLNDEPTQKATNSYSEMNENELLAEYQRLHQETSYAPLDNKTKLDNINKMKKIQKELESKGFTIGVTGDLQNKTTIINHKYTDQKADIHNNTKTENKINEKIKKELGNIEEADMPKQDAISKQTRLQKLGLALSTAFDKWIDKIQNLNISDIAVVPDWIKNIKAQFKKFPEFGNQLLGYLKKQLNKLEDIGSDILDDSAKGISSMGSKLTKKLANLQDKISDAIDSLTDVKHYNKIAKSINKHFADIEDVFDNLWNQLNTKAQQLDLELGTNLVKKKVKTPYDNLIPKDPQAVKNIANYYHADVVDVNKSTKHFKKGDRFVLDLATNKHAQISLGPIMSIDLSEPRLAKLLMNLKEGESITIGSFEGHATYRMGSSANGVSHEHLIVTKQNGVYVFKDTSTYGTHISKNSAEPIKAKDVQSMFFGNHTKGSYYMSKVHNGSINLTSEDYQNIAKLMNKCDGKYRKLWESTFLLDNGRNIDKLAAFENLIRKHGTFDYYLNLDDKTWAVVVENICQKHETAVEAISNYKASSSAINQSLSNHVAYSVKTAQHINDMTNYLNTQTINKHIKVYRGEQYNGSLSLLKFPNGMSVGQAMENLIKKGASQQEIKSFVNKYLIGTKFKQERFMSTALNKQFCEDWAKSNAMGHTGSNPYGSVVWEIDVPGETKGAFVEDFNTFYGEEYEVILQRESSLIIKGAYFDKAKNQWVIQAKVKQTPYNEIQKY